MTLEQWASTTPTAEAVISEKGIRTFAELESNTNRLIRVLRARGLKAGDGVALVCSNRPEFAEAYFACVRGGFRLTPVNWHLSAEEVAYIVGDCEAKVLIAEDILVAHDVDVLSRLCPHNLVVGESTVTGFDGYNDAISRESGAPISDPSPGGLMLYTSGTTGRPKGVWRPLGSVSASSTTNVANYTTGDAHLLTGPLYHSAPIAFSLSIPINHGASVVMSNKFDAQETLRLIECHRVTHSHMVPTMFHRLLALPESVRDFYVTSSLRYIIHGAAPCPVAVKRAIIEWFGPIVWEYYAATEGFATIVDSKTWLAHPGTVGRPLVAGSVFVGDADGNELPAREVGNVYIKSPAGSRFKYFKDDAKTSSAFRGDYFSLGDVGYQDDDGYLYLTDRSVNLIISGGVNIYPAEIDAVLLEHPTVADVATIGVPDSEWGERVVAVVELRSEHEPSNELAEQLITFCRERIAHYKCPRSIEFEESLPRQDNGKIYKRLLRERFRTQQIGTHQ